MNRNQKVVIAGANGFVGRALRQELVRSREVIGLTRGRPPTASGDGVQWRQCDLFSFSQARQALQGATHAVYLVHSMLPSAQLTQGSFENLDLLVADNFARAAAAAGVNHIVYLGGIIPEGVTLSRHLESRLEVEKALAGYGNVVISLRAAMIFGPGGSSMEILLRLIKRLPLMVCPSWTATESSPIYLGNVVSCIRHILDTPQEVSDWYDIAGPTTLSYIDMMREAARHMGRSLRIVRAPVLTPKLSRLWVSTITGAPGNLVKPLVESLKARMTPRPSRMLRPPDVTFLSYSEMLKASLSSSDSDVRVSKAPRAFRLPSDERSKHTVRSVQRLYRSDGLSTSEVASEYLRWLPKALRPFLQVRTQEQDVMICLPGLRQPLLCLRWEQGASSVSRVVLSIRGGLLAKHHKKARVEFRVVESLGVFLVCIHDYYPRLPWYVYVLTQANVHLLVMRAFNRHLKRIDGKRRVSA